MILGKRLLFDPDPQGGGDPPAPAPAPAPNPAPAPAPKPPDGDPPKPKSSNDGSIPLTLHQEKVDGLHGDLSKVRGKNKELGDKLTEAEKKIAAYELKDKKSSAFDAAVAALGDDFELPSDKLPKVKEFLGDLPDSEKLNEKVAEFLDLVKAPKAKTPPIRSPFGANAPPAPKGNKEYTPTELLELAGKDPAAFKEALRNR